MRKKTVDDTYKKRGRWKNRERLPFIYERECVWEREGVICGNISPLSWGNRQAAILWFHQYFWQDRDCNLVSILSIGINSCKNDGSSVWCLNFLTPSKFFPKCPLITMWLRLVSMPKRLGQQMALFWLNVRQFCIQCRFPF